VGKKIKKSQSFEVISHWHLDCCLVSDILGQPVSQAVQEAVLAKFKHED
jgi:hypothetical protein